MARKIPWWRWLVVFKIVALLLAITVFVLLDAQSRLGTNQLVPIFLIATAASAAAWYLRSQQAFQIVFGLGLAGVGYTLLVLLLNGFLWQGVLDFGCYLSTGSLPYALRELVCRLADLRV